LHDNLSILRDHNAEPVLIVPHEKIRTRAWKKLAGNELIVLADSGFEVSLMYGVAFQMPVHSDTSNTPGTFLVNRDGIIKKAWAGQGEENWADHPGLPEILNAIEEV